MQPPPDSGLTEEDVALQARLVDQMLELLAVLDAIVGDNGEAEDEPTA
jgi:hypothetical protein